MIIQKEKGEKEMVEELRRLGIKMFMTGAGIMERMLRGEITTSDLSENELDLVLAAWDTRHHVPRNQIENADKVKPNITKEEVDLGIYSEEEYKRNYVEQIEKYLKVAM